MTTRNIRTVTHWTPEEENLIVSVILAEITIGNTMQQAYNIAAEKVNRAFKNNRTSDGIAFRWSTVLKERYIKEFDRAKAAGKVERSRNGGPLKPTTKQIEMETLQKEQDEVTAFIKNSTLNNVAKLSIEKETSNESSELKEQDDVLQYLDKIKSFVEAKTDSVEAVKNELAEEQHKNKQLQSKYEALEKKYETLQEDYNAVLKVIDRARALTVKEENPIEEKSQANKFKMERNGNLVSR